MKINLKIIGTFILMDCYALKKKPASVYFVYIFGEKLWKGRLLLIFSMYVYHIYNIRIYIEVFIWIPRVMQTGLVFLFPDFKVSLFLFIYLHIY